MCELILLGVLVVIAVVLAGILAAIKNGFNEVIKGLEVLADGSPGRDAEARGGDGP